MTQKNEMLEKNLDSIDPLAGVDLERLASGAEADELLTAILSTPTQESRRHPKASARAFPIARRRSILTALTVAAVALLGLIVGLPGVGNGAPDTLPALARVANAAAAQPAPMTDFPYLYVKTREMNTNTSVAGGQAWSVYDSSTNEEWIAGDGSGRVRRVDAPPRWVGPSDRKAWEAAGRISFLAYGWGSHTEEEDVPVGHFNHRLMGGSDLSELPTDPTELATWLEDRVTDPKANAGAGNGFPISVRTLTLTAEILNNPLATPELRAALYEAEGLIPGIEYLGNSTDAIGRRGVAVGAESANSGAPTLYSLIFDPKTSQVLATEGMMLKPPSGLSGEKTPLLTEAKLFIESGGTDSPSDKPQGG
jgi:hypothetical protein